MPRVSPTRVIAALCVGAALLCAPSVLFAQGAEEPAVAEYAEHPQTKRPYRVAFSWHDRLVLESMTTAWDGAAGSLPWGHVGASWRFSFGLDFPEEEIWWRFRQETVALQYRLPVDSASWSGRLRLIEAEYLRHDTSSFILIPAKRDIKLPAPFDIAIDWRAGDAFWDQTPQGPRWRRIDIGELAALADFVRDENYRARLALGPMARYRLDREGDVWAQHLVPLSGATLRFGWENARGTFLWRGRVNGLYDATLRGRGASPQWGWQVEGATEAELVLVALNDHPLSIPVGFEVSAHEHDAWRPSWAATIGLRLWVWAGDRS